MSFRFIVAVVALTGSSGGLSAARAQNQQPAYQEAVPPPGVVTGYISAGGRTGALIAGGRTVYSNDTFTVTSVGRTVTWKVLGLDGMSGSFARAVSAEAEHAPPPGAADFGGLVSVLQKGASAYRAASTSLLKDRAMAELRDSAQAWCESNGQIRVKAELSELAMAGDGSARIRLRDADTGSFRSLRAPDLYIGPWSETTVRISRERALQCKAGDTVILWGRPVFRPQSEMAVIDGVIRQTALVGFRVLSDASPIGALELAQPECEIYDPKKDTVKAE